MLCSIYICFIEEATITLESIIQRKEEELLSTNLGEEIVMMDTQSGNYIGMNKMGKIIWDRLDKPTLIKDLINYLTNRFDVSEEECTKECLVYLQQMLQQKLITLI